MKTTFFARLLLCPFFLLAFPFFACGDAPSPAPLPTSESSSVQEDREKWDVSDADVSYLSPERSLIALTFDDAPSKTLENILAVFAEYNEKNPDCRATATIFCNGQRITERAAQDLRLALTLGFELGNHTQAHLDLTTLDEPRLREEIVRTDERLALIDGKPVHLLRPPFGNYDERVRRAAQTPIVHWSIDTLDWTGVSEEEIYSCVMREKFDGAIALLHDGYTSTVAALKRLLPDLKAAGYQVVGVSAMAKAHACELRRGGVYIRARKRK